MVESGNRKKILIINNGYLHRSAGGGDAHLLSVGAEWAKQNEVEVLLPNFVKDFVKGPVCRIYRAWIPQTTLGLVLAYICRICQSCVLAWRIRSDITVSCSILVDVLPAWIHTRKNNTLFVLYIFHLIPRRKGCNKAQSVQYFISWVAQKLAIPFYRKANLIFTDNSLVKAELIALGISKDKIHIQCPVVDVAAARDAIPLRKFQIVFIGRLVRQKGVFDLLEAVAPLDATVGIIGKGEELDGMTEYIRRNNLVSRVQLLGFVSDEDKYRLLKGSDLLVLPSYEEGYGIVIGEAIAAGCPVVAYELPHYRETFRDSIMTVPVGDVKALREKIRLALSDECLRDKVRERYEKVVLRSAVSAATEEGRLIDRALLG